MKKYLFAFVLFTSLILSCTIEEEVEVDVERICGTYNGHTLYTGPQGGCYYYNSSNNKTYVDRSNCNCL
ncbi:MAG: hypothetical protein JXR05_12435 [Flavobacteriaceae bacterium]